MNAELAHDATNLVVDRVGAAAQKLANLFVAIATAAEAQKHIEFGRAQTPAHFPSNRLEVVAAWGIIILIEGRRDGRDVLIMTGR